MRVLLLVMVALLNGCATYDTEKMAERMWNRYTAGESTFDGSRYIDIDNMHCGPSIRLALHQNTRQAESGLVLVKVGVAYIANIDNGEILELKIDGKHKKYKTNSSTTQHDTLYFDYGVTDRFSYKTILMSEADVKAAAEAKSLLARVHLLNNTYADGDCVEYENYAAQRGFRMFAQHL